MIDMTYSFVDIPNNCLMTVITDHPKDRNTLAVLKGIAVTFGGAIVGLPLPVLLGAMPDNKVKAFAIVIGGGAAIMTSFVTLGALGVKERVPAEEEQQYSVRELLTILAAAFIFRLYPLTNNKMKEITLELHERRIARGEIEEEIATETPIEGK